MVSNSGPDDDEYEDESDEADEAPDESDETEVAEDVADDDGDDDDDEADDDELFFLFSERAFLAERASSTAARLRFSRALTPLTRVLSWPASPKAIASFSGLSLSSSEPTSLSMSSSSSLVAPIVRACVSNDSPDDACPLDDVELVSDEDEEDEDMDGAESGVCVGGEVRVQGMNRAAGQSRVEVEV